MPGISEKHREVGLRNIRLAKAALASVSPPAERKPVPSSATRVPLRTSTGEVVDVAYDAGPSFRHGLELLAATGTDGPRARLPYSDDAS